MYKEVLYEEGIVKEVKEDTAVITLSCSESCKECSIKIYCKPGNSEERNLVVRDPYGVKPGDTVRISIGGGKILSASIQLYGIPLLVLVIGIFSGMMIFQTNKELFSSLIAVTLVVIYAIILSRLSKKEIKDNLPLIVLVKPLTVEQ